MGRYGALWMVNMLNKLRTADKNKDFVAKFSESSRAFLAQRCANSRGRYLMIAQYGERRRRGVVMVPEGVNGEGWTSIMHVFQKVIEFFVARDSEARRKKGRTYAEVTGSVLANQNAYQGTKLRREREDCESDTRPQTDAHTYEGQSLFLREAYVGGLHDQCVDRAEIMARVQELKGVLDELMKLVGSRSEMGSRMLCCHKCGDEMYEYPPVGEQRGTLTHKEVPSTAVHAKEPICEFQKRDEVGHAENDVVVDCVGLDKEAVDSRVEIEQEAAPLPKERGVCMENLEAAIVGVMDTRVVNTYNRRYSKPQKESDMGSERALVLWVDDTKNGRIGSEAQAG